MSIYSFPDKFSLLTPSGIAGRSCGMGFLLVNSSLNDQECVQCLQNSYTLSPFYGCEEDKCFPRNCRKCPKAADCSTLEFRSVAVGSVWEEEQASDLSGLQKRILSCPAGYKMMRDQEAPDQDNCLKCSKDYYRLTPVVWQGNSSLLPDCHPCPKGIFMYKHIYIHAYIHHTRTHIHRFTHTHKHRRTNTKKY